LRYQCREVAMQPLYTKSVPQQQKITIRIYL
jgi:hypothetical protein